MTRRHRLDAIERLTAVFACTGACRRCCAESAGRVVPPGRLTAPEQAATLYDFLEEAGLRLVPVKEGEAWS